MRSLSLSTLLFALLLPLSGCGALGLFGGPSDLTFVEVAGRYEFRTFVLDPVSNAVREYEVLGEEVSEDMTLLLQEDGTVRMETLRGDRIDAVLARGSYTISGRTVRVSFDDGREVDEFFMPSEIDFEGGDERLRTEIFQEGVNLERISSDYRGITRADIVARIELREIG